MGVLVALITALYYSGDFWFFFFIVIIGFVLYGLLRSYFRERKLYQERRMLLQELLAQNSLAVVECKGSRILALPNYEDEGNTFFIEIGEGRLLCLHQYYDGLDFFSPNDHIKFYADEEVRRVLGPGMELLGQPVVPLLILGEVKQALMDALNWPEHLAVLEMSIEDVLELGKQALEEKRP